MNIYKKLMEENRTKCTANKAAKYVQAGCAVQTLEMSLAWSSMWMTLSVHAAVTGQ